MLKHCRIYFNWVQYSVFEGELSDAQFEKFIKRMGRKFDKKSDSLLIYKLRNRSVFKRRTIGIEKNIITNII